MLEEECCDTCTNTHIIYLFVYIRFQGLNFEIQVGFMFKIQEGLSAFANALNE
jgi:hypothetical protein